MRRDTDLRAEVSKLAILVILLFSSGCLGAAAAPSKLGHDDKSNPSTWIHGIGDDRSARPHREWIRGGNALPLGGLRPTGMDAFEPTLGSDPEGRIFLYAMPQTLPRIVRTDDQAETWQDVTPTLLQGAYPKTTLDPYLHVDPDTGRVFVFDLQGACQSLSTSDDQGRSWTVNPLACGAGGYHDHQTLWTAKARTLSPIGYSNLVHYCVNRLSDAACSRSLDGGRTWTPLRPLVFGPVAPEAAHADKVCLGVHGQGAAARDGTLYLPTAHCGIPSVAISRDDGITWTVATIAQGPISPRGHTAVGIEELVPIRDHEISLAVDLAGKVYALWISAEDLLPYVAASRDGGASWTRPRAIAPAGVETSAFPALAAGSDGRIVAAYYGTTANKEWHAMTPEDVWNGYLTMILDADTEDALAATTIVNPPGDPLARGVCGGSRCPDDRGVGDFIDIQVDRAGRPWAAFVDTCHRLCVHDGLLDAAEGVLGTFLQGPSLLGDGRLDTILPPGNTDQPRGHQTFYRNATIAGQTRAIIAPASIKVSGGITYGPAFMVHEGATGILFEVRWDEPTAGLVLEHYNDRYRRVFSTPETALGATSVRAVGHTPQMLAPILGETVLTSAASVQTHFSVAVTVFYEHPADDFTAWGLP